LIEVTDVLGCIPHLLEGTDRPIDIVVEPMQDALVFEQSDRQLVVWYDHCKPYHVLIKLKAFDLTPFEEVADRHDLH
jgi:hypothetical protein